MAWHQGITQRLLCLGQQLSNPPRRQLLTAGQVSPAHPGLPNTMARADQPGESLELSIDAALPELQRLQQLVQLLIPLRLWRCQQIADGCAVAALGDHVQRCHDLNRTACCHQVIGSVAIAGAAQCGRNCRRQLNEPVRVGLNGQALPDPPPRISGEPVALARLELLSGALEPNTAGLQPVQHVSAGQLTPRLVGHQSQVGRDHAITGAQAAAFDLPGGLIRPGRVVLPGADHGAEVDFLGWREQRHPPGSLQPMSDAIGGHGQSGAARIAPAPITPAARYWPAAKAASEPPSNREKQSRRRVARVVISAPW